MRHRSVLTKWRDLNKAIATPDPEKQRVKSILVRDQDSAEQEADRRAKGLPDGPAVQTDTHQPRPVYDEKTGAQIIGRTGIKQETQFQRACRLAQLVDKAMCTDEKAKAVEIERALDRRDAGNAFVDAWDMRYRSGKDSTDLSRGGSAANSAGISDTQIDAGNLMAGWERHMGANDWMLVRRVCGENYAIAQAVSEISIGYRDSSLARFREAMDGLIRARTDARKCEWCRRNKPHGTPL